MAMKIPLKKSQSMELGSSTVDLDTQKEEVTQIVLSKSLFNEDVMKKEINWFYGPLGLHEFYFSGNSALTIAGHIESLVASKFLSVSSGNVMELKLVNKSEKSAFFATRSNVQGDACTSNCRFSPNHVGPTEVESLERSIERKYLSNGQLNPIIGDGVLAGYDQLPSALRRKTTDPEDRSSSPGLFRLQCYRSSGVLDKELVPMHVRMYFLQAPEYPTTEPDEKEWRIEKVADKRFLDRAGDNLKNIYQRVMKEAMNQMTPAFDTELWAEPDGSHMARFVVAYKTGATHSYFSSLADVYRAHGLFSTRKYVEFFNNGIVIYGFYLQQLEPTASRGSGTFEERIADCVTDASMHFVLPRTSLTPMLCDNVLSPPQISYAYAAWKFAFHFLHRLPEAYSVLATTLRAKDPSVLSRLETLRNTMKFHTYTESQILEEILASPALVKVLYQDFVACHQPQQKSTIMDKSDMLSMIRKKSPNENAVAIFNMFYTFNQHILRTNFFTSKKSALAFRLDGNFLSKTEYPETPFAIIFVIGSEFRGFHVRFLDIARGGIRMVRSSGAQVFVRNVSSLFDECYSLASTQQRKNKDIPEGGSKGIVLLNLAHQDKTTVAFQKYIDALLDLMLPVVDDDVGKTEEELLFLGPDEGTADYMDWASAYAHTRKYRYWKAFTTGKSRSLGGIPHDLYGMTTHSVRQYVVGIQRQLKLCPPLTKVQTGGPDGDLGSNEILMSQSEEHTIAIVDGSGVLYAPEGLPAGDICALARAREPISALDPSVLASVPGAYQVLVSDQDVTLPSGEIVENGLAFRNTFHLNPELSADFFVPCGGRPSAVNLSNVEAFCYRADGKTLRFRYVVEGANLFFTQDARLVLEKAGVILFKDASANKGGVTSSSLEVMAAMVMQDDEFASHMSVSEASAPPAFYQAYVKQVQDRIDANARLEFECLWHEHVVSGKPLSILSNVLSEKITTLTIQIQHSSLWGDVQLRQNVLEQAIPQALVELLGYEVIATRLPVSYAQAVFASQLASRFVYSAGLQAPEFAFYEFIQASTRKEE